MKSVVTLFFVCLLVVFALFDTGMYLFPISYFGHNSINAVLLGKCKSMG